MSLSRRKRQLQNLREKAEELEAPQDLEDRFGPYRDNPVGFVEEQLGVDPEPYQRDVLTAAVQDSRITWRAAHGVGKTTVLSWTLLWWLLTRPFSRVLIVAPAYERQVGRYLLPEVRKWNRRAPEPLPIEVRAQTVEVQGFGREWFATGVQASDPSKIEGAHAESVAVLADEAKGLPADVVAALHGTQTDQSDDRLYLLASVPGGPSGPFYDSCRSDAWASFHTAASDSALVADQWIEERREEWGEGSPLFTARVEGEFPEEDEGTLFPLSDLEAAAERSLDFPEGIPPISFGVDPARHGDDRSALAVWRGPELAEIRTRRGMDTMEVATWISTEINRRDPASVSVDEIGIGAGVLDRLHDLGHRGVVEGVNVGAKAERSDLYQNLRAETFWQMREAVVGGEVSLPDDDDLLAELSAFRFGYSGGKIALESKSDTKKRVGRSPDLADAVALGFEAHEARKRREPQPILGPHNSWGDDPTSELEKIPGYSSIYLDKRDHVVDADGTDFGHIDDTPFTV